MVLKRGHLQRHLERFLFTLSEGEDCGEGEKQKTEDWGKILCPRSTYCVKNLLQFINKHEITSF